MATIKDVAKLAGVGIGTASRAISGRGAVAPDTLRRVQDAVKALDFRPSNIARALALKTLGMLGVYVQHFDGLFYGPILGTIDAELRAVDRHMVAANGCGGGDARQQALDAIDFLIQRECDGILLVSNDLTDADLVELAQRCEHLVVLNRRVAALKLQCFTCDHKRAGRQAALALLARGHHDIATLSGPHNAPDNEARMAGFKDELARHGVKLKRAHQVDGDFSFASGHAGAKALLQPARRGWSALFCANDLMAIGAIACFAEAGLRVPHDVSVLGFDDSVIAAYSMPPLTTVRVPIEDVAANGCRYLINLCYGLALPVQREFPSSVVWRRSVGDGPNIRSAPRNLDIPTRSPERAALP
jgi:LacI family transcriptional regulator